MEIRRRIHKDKWTIEIVSAKAMKKLADDEDVTGLCQETEKTISIREDSIQYEIVAHELFHAYWSYLYLGDTNNIKLDDMEEIGASFFAAQGVEMVRKAKKITRDLQKLYNEEKEE